MVIAVEGLKRCRLDDDEVDAGSRDLLPPLLRQPGVGNQEIDRIEPGDKRQALAAKLRAIRHDKHLPSSPEHRLLGFRQEQVGGVETFGGDPRRRQDRRCHMEPAEELVGIGPQADARPRRDIAAKEHEIGP